MMRRAFTLLELLVVVGIMGILGTASVGGYRAMRQGMEEKGVMQNVNALVRAAYQRAQVDRQPTAVFFWNETIRAADEDSEPVVVGKAVAVRRSGRISAMMGQYLYDEFADLELAYPTDEDNTTQNSENSMFLYPLDDVDDVESSSNLRRSTVEGKVYKKTLTPVYLFDTGTKSENLSGSAESDEKTGKVITYAFKLVDQGGVTWEPGMAYGFEFANLELPHGYIFGSSYSDSLSEPLKAAGTLVFDVGYNDNNGMNSSGATAGLGSRSTVMVYALRPDSSGNLAAQRVGTSDSPTTAIR